MKTLATVLGVETIGIIVSFKVESFQKRIERKKKSYYPFDPSIMH